MDGNATHQELGKALGQKSAGFSFTILQTQPPQEHMLFALWLAKDFHQGIG
jgi:hypothetical protein